MIIWRNDKKNKSCFSLTRCGTVNARVVSRDFVFYAMHFKCISLIFLVTIAILQTRQYLLFYRGNPAIPVFGIVCLKVPSFILQRDDGKFETVF